MKADKPFEEIQVSDKATWRWIREGDIYVSRMTQDHMNQFKKDIEQSILPKREWVGLMDEEIEVIAKRLMDDAAYCSLHFAVAIGAALRKKNT